MKAIETVGILGLGKMGCPIAAHLVAKGFKVVGYDPLEEARKKAVALGALSAALRVELTPSRKLGYFGVVSREARSGAAGRGPTGSEIGGHMGAYSDLMWQLLVQFLIM